MQVKLLRRAMMQNMLQNLNNLRKLAKLICFFFFLLVLKLVKASMLIPRVLQNFGVFTAYLGS